MIDVEWQPLETDSNASSLEDVMSGCGEVVRNMLQEFADVADVVVMPLVWMDFPAGVAQDKSGN